MTVQAAAGPHGLFSGPPRYVPQSPWEPVPAILVTIVACGAALVVGIVAIGAGIAAWGASFAESGTAIEAFFSLASPSGVAIAAGTHLASLAIIWLSAGYKGMRREVLQLSGAIPGWQTLLLGGLVAVVATTVLEALMYATTQFDIFADSKMLRDGLRGPYWWGTVVIAVVFAPLWEELTFRGFLMSALSKTRLGFWGAGIISNVMWTLLHWGYSWQGLVSVFTAGLVLTLIMQRTGSIWAPIAAHAIANACALGFAYWVG